MPTNRTHRRQHRRWTPEHRETLLTGRCYFHEHAPGFYLASGDLNLNQIEAAWRELEDDLLARFVLDHPGARPWAWWRFDAPEPTRQWISGFDAFANGPVDLLVSEILDWGVGWYVSVGEGEFKDPPIVETQAGYLERHGLLIDVERVALGPDFPRQEAMCAKEEIRR